jgi:CRISPR system Cascade subunit CasE
MFISRASLVETDGALGVLAKLLGRRTDAYARHELIWSLFAGADTAPRDFLYREIVGRHPSWLIVSARAPTDTLGLWRIDSKPFAPAIAQGQRLGFALRANPTVSRSKPVGGQAVGRHDVVMAAMKRDGVSRDEAVATAGLAWLQRQGLRAGFAVEPKGLRIGGYMRHQFERPGGKPMVLASLDFEGVIAVTDADAFVRVLAAGLGRGKAFGFGLLLVRKAGRTAPIGAAHDTDE